MPAKIGERRRFGDEIGEWDGHDWIALPPSVEPPPGDGGEQPQRVLPFKGGTRPASESEWQEAQTIQQDPLRRGIALGADVGLSSMLPLGAVLKMAPRALGMVGRGLELASRIPNVREMAGMAGRGLQRVATPATKAPAVSAESEAYIAARVKDILAQKAAQAAKAAPVVAEAAKAAPVAAPVARNLEAEAAALLGRMRSSDPFGALKAAQAAQAAKASPVSAALQQAPVAAMQNPSTALGTAMQRPGVPMAQQADALKSAIMNWKLNDKLSNAQIAASLEQTFGFPPDLAKQAVKMVVESIQ